MTQTDVQKLTPEEVENLFQETNDWTTKWWCVDFACSNMCKKLLKGIHMPPDRFELRYQEAVFEVMEKIKNGVKIDKLSSFIYWPCKRALQNKAVIQEDRELLSYEQHTENVLNKENRYEFTD